MQSLNELVRNIADGKRAAHAFACEGIAGEARSAFVTALAQGLECTSEDEGARPCGRCPACRQVAAGTSLDVVHMNKSTGSGKTARAVYKVDDASTFIERLSMGAYGRYLIGIIDDADSMSEVVQNKLLKTLEEPGENTVIILAVSNRDNLLSTVRSRCSDIRISDYLNTDREMYGAADEDQDMLHAGGAVTSEKQLQTMKELSGLIRDRKSNFYEFRNLMDKNIKSREEALLFLDILEDDLRDTLRNDERLGVRKESAAGIELASIARMDIRREMAYSKALRRLYLEFR